MHGIFKRRHLAGWEFPLTHFMPPQTPGADVARKRLNGRFAALLVTTAVVAAPAALMPSLAIIALGLSSAPAVADGGAGGGAGTGPDGKAGVGPVGGQDNPTGTGGQGGSGDDMFAAGGGGGAGYQQGGAGGSGGLNASGGGGGTHGFVGSSLGFIGGFYGTDGGDGGNSTVLGERFFWVAGSTARNIRGGGGGAGGYGAVVTSGASTNILRDVTGGNGGNGGNASYAGVAGILSEQSGSGGSGGVGLLFTNPVGSEVEIAATVKGGAGGSRGTGRGNLVDYGFFDPTMRGKGHRLDQLNSATPGKGGVGISGQNLNITMNDGGSVAGGSGADAIHFTGGVNSLSILDTKSISGRVTAFSKSDTLILNNTISNGSFELGLLNSQYINFGHLVKTGGGTWTINGLSQRSALDLNVQQGQLNVLASWEVMGQATNSGTLWVLPGALLRIDAGLTNNRIFKVVAGGTFLGSLTNTAFTTTNGGSINGNVIISGGTVALIGAGTISGGVNLTNAAGKFDISGTNAGATINTLDGVANSQVTLGEQTLTIDRGSTNYAGIIQGTGGLTIAGGKQVLSGINTYTGETNVNAGNLDVNGSIESSSVVNVNKGGTLSGNGTFGNVNNNGGTVSPGNSIGTIHIDGNFYMGPSSTYYAEINGDTSDLIKVSGSANIQSSVFEIAHDTNKAAAPVVPGKTYTLITTNGGLTGTAPDVAIADFPFLTFHLSSDGLNGTLTTARGAGAFAELATTRNEKAVASALDTMAAANPLWRQVVGATEAQARSAFTSLSNASIHANATGVLSEQSYYLRDAVTRRLRQDFAYGASLAPEGSALSYAEEEPRNACAAASAIPFCKAPPLAALAPPVYAVWAQALGSWGSLKGDGNAAHTDQSLGGIISGMDVTFDGRWRVGLAGGYSQSIFRSPSIAASGSSDSYHIALYGGGQVGAWGLRGGASFSWNDILASRQVNVVNVGGSQRGDYAAKTTQVFGEVGHGFAFAATTLEPFANIAYVNVDGAVNELGVAAVTGSSKLATTYTTLGLRGAVPLTGTLTARGTLGWRHALGDITPMAALAFQSGGAAFALAGSPIARDALVSEAGLDLVVAPNASLGISWTNQFADQSYDNTVKGNFTWNF
ncbi:autotransporter domain-containing protein [Rhodoblastus sp.]|uniref:autotransporter outer membrane beta-barrel domain-containing protein n=1 Tax=Rhodoblastus sp. TaxID=1962975 RepID=UPI0025F299C4|nr:autotransporter domain-containing protein [Rhodoblastus sp.]